MNEINKTRNKLIRMKVRENFGQKQLRALEDYIGYMGDYNQIDQRNIIQCLNGLKTYCEDKSQ